MKGLYIGIGVSFAVAAIVGSIAIIKHKRKRKYKYKGNSDDIDGGVVKRIYADMPKVIESADITEFNCEISLFAAVDTEGLENRVYKLNAVLENGEIIVTYEWYDRCGESKKAECKTKSDFMMHLQKIVSDYNFAQHNGYTHTVSGLPHMYGETINIVYESNEHIYAHDNQSGFLPFEAVKKLITLFENVTKVNSKHIAGS